jgi:thiol-disulfide isomerase/thioredoxin
MTLIGLILAVGGILCAVYASRALAGLLFAGAVVILLLPAPGGGGGGTAGGGPGGPYGFEMASRLRTAPEAHFKGENGAELSLADFRGQVVLLNIWATWCGPCRAEMPSLDRLQARHGGDGLRVVAISVDDGGLPMVRRFFQQRSIRNLKLYADNDHSTAAAFDVGGIPMTVLIDREGNVVGELVGGTQWDSPEAVELVGRYLED